MTDSNTLTLGMQSTVDTHTTTASQQAYHSKYINNRIENGTYRPETVPSDVTGLPRDIEIYRAERKSDLIKFTWHGNAETFCPRQWADLAIGSGSCGYQCRYCFLIFTFRSMRNPARPVVYSNVEDFEREARRWLLHNKRRARHTLGLGIDCADSLLFEGITGHARRLITIFADPECNPNGCKLILLTKSTNVHYLDGLPAGNAPVAVTFSVNPEPIADLWEGKYADTGERITPPIERRLQACVEAQRMGYDTRLRLDPILTPDGWQDMYHEFFADCQRTGLRPSRITLGTYREKNSQLDDWRERWGLPAPEHVPGDLAHTGTHWHVPDECRAETYTIVRALANKYLPDAQVGLCKETHVLRKQCGMRNFHCNCLP